MIYLTLIERVLEHLPAQQARPYSIASWSGSALKYDIAFSMVDIPQGNVRRFPRKGISTGWLQSFCESNKRSSELFLYKRHKKAFAPPLCLKKPYIMIGAGTGLAPFRGFLQHREHLFNEKKQTESVGLSDIGSTWLIFGCRDRKLDFIYQDEIENFSQNNVLTKLDCAFSRENEEIKYVQDVIKSNSKEVVKCLIDNGALLYVCGDELTMAKDVQESIVQALVIEANLTEPEARKKIADMRLNDEYLQDLWG